MYNCRSLKPGFKAAAESRLVKPDSNEGVDISIVANPTEECFDYKLELANMDTPFVYVGLITCEGSRCAMTHGRIRIECFRRGGAAPRSLLMRISCFLLERTETSWVMRVLLVYLA
jgi:hypothetical protein